MNAAASPAVAAWRRGGRLVIGLLLAGLLVSCGGPLGPARPTPIADRPINLDGNCSQTDEDGFREQVRLQVDDNVVRALSWQLWVGRKGSCRFEQAQFRQTQRRPHVELIANDGGGCKLMIWQDPRRVTLAHAGCQRFCTGNIYDEAWPAMFDPSSGRCARTD